MSATRSIVRRNIAAGVGPAEVLRRVNASLRDDFPPGRFVTLIYAVLDGERHTVTFSSAGHLPPLLHRGGCSSCIVTEAGFPLGIFDSDYSESTVEMHPGSSVLFYTDGIVETADRAGNEYGIDRLSAALDGPDPCARTLTEEVIRYSGGENLGDDATVVLLRRM